jgi:hypothetical protein
MKKVKVVAATEEQKAIAVVPQETYGDTVTSLAVAPAAPAAVAPMFAPKPKPKLAAAAPAAPPKQVKVPVARTDGPSVDVKKKTLRTINEALAELVNKGINFEDVRTEPGPDGRATFTVSIPVPAETLKVLDADFKTLRFTPEGFSGVEGPDFDADIQKLKQDFVDVSRELKGAVEPITVKEQKAADVLYDLAKFPENFQILGKQILDQKFGSHYLEDTPPPFVPTTRRGFSESIETVYRKFILPAHEEQLDFEACAKQGVQGQTKAEMYLYQQFVREYMRQESPYRGVLVYHGLGSGKTCSAIATAEALFANGHKKIVVMTPFSLRKNFLKEITFCGFQHFRLQNHWVPFDLKNPTTRLFAKEVYGVPDKYKAATLWIPDFSKSAEPNYKTLEARQQTEIRAQINAVLNEMITFINYNGVSAAKLKEYACMPPGQRPFDNAVIVVDEVHNLVRLMQGTIEPYLINKPMHRRRILPEPIKVGNWVPGLCGKPKNYRRGYLFYRLLLDAKNSKVVALSGTPLINFPEELGILANILHGYIPIAQGSVVETDPVSTNTIEKTAAQHPFIDFVRVTSNPMGTQILITPLPEGTRKIFGPDGDMTGVTRMGQDEDIPTFQDIIKSFKDELTAKKIRVKGEFSLSTEALLPPFGEQFHTTFIDTDKGEIKNMNVLAKRLTGLISYYKGSKEELMPLVTKDEVVRVPMSIYQAREYSRLRGVEVKKELKDSLKGPVIPASDIWAEVYQINDKSQPSNYRMESRQACSFVFPEEVTRPRPRTQKELQEDIGRDPVDLVDQEAEVGAAAAKEEFADLGLARDEASEEVLKAEDEQIMKEEEEAADAADAADAAQQGQQEEGDAALAPAPTTTVEEAERRAKIFAEATPLDAKIAEGKKLTIKELQIIRDRDLILCKAADGPYKEACEQAKKCLRKFSGKKLTLSNPAPNNLFTYSAKYAAILERIESAPGSSLVYSQFLGMEGIGIFSIVMDLNGYVPIKIEASKEGLRFDEKTLASLKKGPTDLTARRYIQFTGEEAEEIRRYNLDLFNARFSELPKNLADVLNEAGFTDNKKGELCRVFCITSAGAEGLSLKNVRRVHIMEPYWNDVRLAQVKGRAVRICSHMELPYDPDPTKNQRTVEVFTYVSIYSAEMQKARDGPLKIDETIASKDALAADYAKRFGFPVPDGADQYVMTSDERLFFISQRKRGILEELLTVMKSAAVDCRLNTYDNEEVQCLQLRGKVGDFLYHPLLDQDILESSVALGGPPGQQAEGAQATEAVYELELGGRKLIAAAVTVAGKVTSYDLFDGADKRRTKKIGTMTADPNTGDPTGKATFN